MTEERAELKAAVGMIAEWATNLEGHAGTLDSMIKEPWQNIDGGQCRLNAKRLRLLISALSQDAKPEPGVTVTEAMVERALDRYNRVTSGARIGDPVPMRAALTAALQPPVAAKPDQEG